ncbi:MAG TPA: HNH endonuclease signature motif containing protein, partial [Nitrososphaeraceae archaeon]|nr:HNH endonuclease signature motif containing protein [Nitrososphaeraceae archaeon]
SLVSLFEYVKGTRADDRFFLGMLFGLVILLALKLRATTSIKISLIPAIASCLAWFIPYFMDDHLNVPNYKTIAILLWSLGIVVLLPKASDNQNRKAFSEAVRKEVIIKQKYKCYKCRKKLLPYGKDFHHKDGNRSNNKISNCQVLCTLCHRRIHLG